MKIRPALMLAALAATWQAPAALAARPFVTDDARLTTAGSCQFESWVRSYPDSREIWALPACNPTGNFEVTLGGGRGRSDGEPANVDEVLQIKTLVKPLQTDGWGWGVALGTVRKHEINPMSNQTGNSYAYLPFSASFDGDRAVLHANVGWLKDRASNGHSTTFGVGGELQLTPRLLAIAETFGDDHRKPYWQVGARLAIIPDRVQIDTTLGQQFSGPSSSRWISFGLRLTPEKLF